MKFLDALTVFTENSPTKFKKDSIKIISVIWSLLAIAQCKLDDVFIVTDNSLDGRSLDVENFINEIRGTIPPEILEELKKTGIKVAEISNPKVEKEKAKKKKAEEKKAKEEKAKEEKIKAEKKADKPVEKENNFDDDFDEIDDDFDDDEDEN